MVLHLIHVVVSKFYLKGILCQLVIMASHMQICWLTLIISFRFCILALKSPLVLGTSFQAQG